MTKKKFLYIFTLLGLALSACNPVFNDDSSVEPSSQDSSGGSSYTSESSEGRDTSTTETSSGSESGSESESESESSSSSEGSSEEPGHNHHYPSTPTAFIDDPDYMSYVKGYNEYHCTYPGCTEVKQETVYYTKAEMLELMNSFINEKSYFDLFEVKQDLIDNNYPIVDALTETNYFGYDLDNNRVALSSENVANFISFKEKEVSTLSELVSEISNIDADASLYSSIKLLNNIDVNQVISVNSAHPIEINLNNKIISNLMDNEPAIKVSKGNATKPVVAIKNGTIQTKEISGFNLDKSPACISLIDANSLRVTKVTLSNRAERGYAYIDFVNKSTNALVKINNSTINSKIVAICIQTNTNNIKDNNINGVVVINGGTSTFTGNTIDATNVQKGLDQEANRLITCPELYEKCHDVYVTENRNTYMLTSTDAILIYDRRSTSSTYANPEVTITNNTLKCKVGDDSTPYGYAVRYMDLDFDPNLSDNSVDLGLITVENNTCTYCSSSEPLNQAGGYIYWEAN